MKSPFKKLTAAALACAMVLPFGVTAFADTADNGKASVFDFGASDYAFNENDATGSFKIKRSGDGDRAARISFKAADLLAEYGVDYEILDSKGKPFAKTEGFKPDPKDFTFEEDGSGLALDESVIAAATADEPETTTVTRSRKTGVEILDAQAEYLDLPSEIEDEVAVDSTQKVVNEMFDYFSKAQGCEGYVDFGIGETEKEITIKINDNSEPNAQRMFALAIMATNDDLATVAPNATTYVTIQDDEDVEHSTYAIKETELRLTSANPEGTVTVTRTGGEMYFSTATISTVSLTAPEGSYEKLDNSTVAFVPGETEKTVAVKALSFDKGGRFGVRLEIDNPEDETGNYYADVTIVKDFNTLRERTSEELKALEGSGAGDVDTLANEEGEETSGITVGSETTNNNFLTSSQYSKSYDEMIRKADKVKGSGSYEFVHESLYSGDVEQVELTKNKQGRFWLTTPEKLNFTGIKSLNAIVGGYGISRFFEQTCESTKNPDNCVNYGGNQNFYKDKGLTSFYEDISIDVSKDYDPAYVTLCVDRREYYDSKSDTRLHYFYYRMPFTENWAKYTFDMQDSAATHQRPIYNFYDGTPSIQYAYFDGTSSKIYSPGKVVCKDEDGNEVSSFYANYNKPLYFSSTDEYAKQYGLYLEGIYFASTSKNVSNMCENGQYVITDNVYYVPVDSATKNSEDPTVKVTIDQEFLYTLWKKGVTSSETKDESIKIFPKYAQRTKTVRFFNTDRPEGNTKYDKDNRFSEIINIVDAYEKYEAASDSEKKGLVKITKSAVTKPVCNATGELGNGLYYVTPQDEAEYTAKLFEYARAVKQGLTIDHYEIEMPVNSVLNLGVKSVAEKIPDGVSWNTLTGKQEAVHTWYAPGMTILSDGLDPKVVLKEADYTKAQIIVTDDIAVRPVTGAQNITVMYHPLEKIPAEYQGDRTVTEMNEEGKEVTVTYKGLDKAVILTDSLDGEQVIGVDDKGYYTEDSVMGKEFSFTAFPPEGYVTYWVDMTQDVNGDGEINFDEQDNARRGTDSPDILGNVFKGQVTADRPRLYYFFYPKTELQNEHTIKGRVKKSSANFVQLSRNVTTVTEEPVSDVVVNVGGYVGVTNRNGEYEIETELPVIGTTNVMLSSAESANYYTYQPLKSNHTITMPALERFTADSILATISYGGKTETINFNARGGTMGVYNGTATVTLKVKSNSAIMPAKARFYIEDQLGNRKVDCDTSKDYTTTNSVYGNTLTTTLKFNPKKDCEDCDRIVVQFSDELGNWYRPIYTGINFFVPIDVEQFAFPLLGSDLIEDAYKDTLAYSLIGDPLGNLLTDKLQGAATKEIYSPSNLSEEARDSMSWSRETYKMQFGKEFKILDKSYDSKKKKKDSDKDKDKSSDSDKDKSSDKDKDSDDYKQDFVEIFDQETGETHAYKYEDIDKATDLDEWEKDIDKQLENAETSNEVLNLFMYKCILDETREYKNDKNGTNDKSGVKDPSETKASSGKYQTKGNFKFSVSANVGFRITLSNREIWDDKNAGTVKHQYFFEDLMFYVQVAPKTSASCSVAMPVGITVSLGFDFSGQITGVYYMYNDYRSDPNEGGMLDTASENLTPFDFHDFNMFDKFGEGSNLRRNFYLFLDPTIAVSVGIKYKIFEVSVTAKFAFDMDFRWTEATYYAYGDVAVYLNYSIKVVGFEVYTDSIGSKNGLVRSKLFNTPNQNGHIGFDKDSATVQPSGAAAELLRAGATEGTFSTSDTPQRAEKSAWNGTPDTPLNAQGTTEITLETGAESDAQVKLMKINDDEMLMVFIDDDHSRSDVNRRAVYYSIGNGTNWSTPKLLDNDGTLDDYPDICDLGNGKLLVTWSSADKVLPDNAGVEDALAALDIKAAFFDKNTKKFGKPEQLTKTTEEDFTADMFPHAAYDEETDRIILYYTKTEYEDIENLEDLGLCSTEYSVTAYLFYEDGKWSNNGSFYTEADMKNIEKTVETETKYDWAEEGKEYTDAELKAAVEQGVKEYKENWYGQRFLDLRTDSNAMKLAVDSAAIGYNGLGLFAWTVDNDNNVNTTDDRDVFLQIYEFSSNTFTHVIKLTDEQGEYAAPKFARSNNNTYLFFGNKVTGEDEDHGEIDYLNISEIVKGEEYTKVEGAQRPYYVLKYTHTDADGNTVEFGVKPDTAVQTDNYEDYQPVVSENGRMYILWGDKSKGGDAVQINAAYYVGDDTEDGSSWSEAAAITNAESGMYYSGIGAAIIGDDIKIGALKGSFESDTENSLMFVNHTPFADVVIDSLTVDTSYPMPGDAVVLTATLKNTGLLAYEGDIEATFTCEGENVGKAAIEEGIQGAAEQSAALNVTLPETEGDIVYAVSALGQTKEITIKKAPVLVAGAQDISMYTDAIDEPYYAFTAEIANDGNADANNVKITVTAGDEELASQTIELLVPNQREEIKLPIEINDALYEVGEDGIGAIDLSVTIECDGDSTDPFEYTVSKEFDMETVANLDKITEIKFADDGKASMKAGETKDIQPTLVGLDNNELSVKWQMSSDQSIARIDENGNIVSLKEGKATLTGIVLPDKSYTQIDAYGRERSISAADKIPADKQKFVEVELTVSRAAEIDILGDLDGDGEVTSADALTALRISAGLENKTPEMIALGDIDGDGEITSADALDILRFSASLSANEKIGKPIAA